MSDKKEIKFGSGYQNNWKIPPLENWKNKKEYYLKTEDRDIGDYPVLSEAEEKEIAKELAFLI